MHPLMYSNSETILEAKNQQYQQQRTCGHLLTLLLLFGLAISALSMSAYTNYRYNHNPITGTTVVSVSQEHSSLVPQPTQTVDPTLNSLVVIEDVHIGGTLVVNEIYNSSGFPFTGPPGPAGPAGRDGLNGTTTTITITNTTYINIIQRFNATFPDNETEAFILCQQWLITVSLDLNVSIDRLECTNVTEGSIIFHYRVKDDPFIPATTVVQQIQETLENPNSTIAQASPGIVLSTINSTVTQQQVVVVNGTNGRDGRDGVDGRNGTDGATGPPGPQGAQGVQGPPGKDGRNGTDGRNGLDGNIIYLTNITDLNLTVLEGPRGEQGPTGPQGPAGPQGDRGIQGAVWRDDSGVPSNSLGVDGDYYLDTDTGNVYVKGSGEYILASNIHGKDGITWIVHEGPPEHEEDEEFGKIGDFLYDSINGDVYQKPFGSWVLLTHLKGPQGPEGPRGTNGTNGTTGPQGPQGPQGPTGPQGPQGPAGQNGSTFVVVNTTTGLLESLFNTTGITFVNITGPAGPKGDTGTQGPIGSIWRSGAGVPFDGVGVDNDFYLDTSNGNVYKRVSGMYMLQTDLTGATGDPGTVWRSSSGVPSNAVGRDGDYHLNTANGDVYTRVSGEYFMSGNIKGPQGIQGLQGPQGPEGPEGPQGVPGTVPAIGFTPPTPEQGTDGSYYIDAASHDLYMKFNGTWVFLYNTVGPQGLPGATILNGTGAPTTNSSSSVGVNGDYYLDTDTGDLYLKSNGTYTLVVHLKGTQGDPGLPGVAPLNGSGAPSNSTGDDGDYYLDTDSGDLYLKVSGAYSLKLNIKGPQGEQGLQGPQGPQGPQGLPGTVPTVGFGPPNDTLGDDGTWYYDALNGSLYAKENGHYSYLTYIIGPQGPQGEQGLQGDPGPPGTAPELGFAPPSDEQGTEGAYFIDASTQNLYIKLNGTWVFLYNTIGPQGTSIRSGTGVPDNSTWYDGDLYLDISNGDLYNKTGGAWVLKLNLKGATGATGATGSQGPTGSTGETGAPGSVWYTGSGLPSNSLGIDGDYYLNTQSSNVYFKSSGTYSLVANIKGATGATGAAGATWRSGSGAPSDSLGVDGDLYLNIANGDVYVRSSGMYSVVTNIKGPTGFTGATGATWYSGSGAPSNGLGVDGDLYLRTDTSDVYLKTSGTYSIILNIKGATGATGSTGSAGTNGATWRTGSGAPSNGLGVDGDLYFRTDTSDVYLRSSGTYSLVANIKGATGTTGATGTAATIEVGTVTTLTPGSSVTVTNSGSSSAATFDFSIPAGAVWRSGLGAPSDSVGVNGDFYLNTATSDVHKKSSGAYSIIVNIKGSTGTTGTAATVAVGTVTTLTPGSSATVTNAGTSSAATLNFGIPSGSTWRSGSGAPSNGVGIDTDMYFRSDTDDVYQRSGGTYSIVGNIQGSAAPFYVMSGTLTTSQVVSIGTSSATNSVIEIPAPGAGLMILVQKATLGGSPVLWTGGQTSTGIHWRYVASGAAFSSSAVSALASTICYPQTSMITNANRLSTCSQIADSTALTTTTYANLPVRIGNTGNTAYACASGTCTLSWSIQYVIIPV